MDQTTATPQHLLQPNLASPERFLSLPKVEGFTSFGSSYIYELIKLGKFPAPIKIGTSSRWRETEVHAWIAEQIKNNNTGKKSRGAK